MLNKLEGVRNSGGSQYMAVCPVHDDREPSLSVGWGDNKVLLRCQAGCETADVVSALGLPWSALSAKSEIVAVYEYVDEEGDLRYEVVRDSPKAFRQRRPVSPRSNKRVWNMTGVTPVPYHLPDLMDALAKGEDVYIVEGEKDVEAMELAYGANATCNHGGGGNWNKAHSKFFIGTRSRVVIVADRDLTGYRAALKTWNSLWEVAKIKAELVMSAVGKDAADHCADHGLDSFVSTSVTELTNLKNAEEAAKNSERSGAGSSENKRNSSGPGTLILQAASEISSRRQKFLWKNRIPLGAVLLFAGRGGVGKSTFAIWLAVEAQHGRLPGDLFGERVTVLYASVEDHWETQMKPRLTAAGADMTRFYKLAIGRVVDDETGESTLRLPEDTPLILEGIRQQAGPVLVILDPITSTISGDDHKREVVRAVLDPLSKIAGETDAVILGIMHFNKGAGNASDKLSGSHAYRDAARAVMLFARDEDEDHVVMSQDKGNYAQIDDMSLAYRLVDTAVTLDDGESAHVARVEIIGETHVSVGQIINRSTSDDGPVVEWLSNYMLAMNGRAPAAEGLAAGEQAGFSKSSITRARRRARPPVESIKSGSGSAPWEWVREEIAPSEETHTKTEETVPEPSAVPSSVRTVRRSFDMSRFE